MEIGRICPLLCARNIGISLTSAFGRSMTLTHGPIDESYCSLLNARECSTANLVTKHVPNLFFVLARIPSLQGHYSGIGKTVMGLLETP